MKVLDSVNTLQALPVLEPNDILRRNVGAKCLVNIMRDLLTSLVCNVASIWIVVDLELGPDDQMYDVRVNAVWPVIEKDLNVS